MNVLALAWKLTLQNPLGGGFGYLGRMYRIDDAIISAYIMDGTGILGALAFMVVVGHLAFQFGSGVLKSPPGSARDLASIGLSTLVVALVAGVSSQSILFEPVHAFVFWALMAVCYCTVVCLFLIYTHSFFSGCKEQILRLSRKTLKNYNSQKG